MKKVTFSAVVAVVLATICITYVAGQFSAPQPQHPSTTPATVQTDTQTSPSDTDQKTMGNAPNVTFSGQSPSDLTVGDIYGIYDILVGRKYCRVVAYRTGPAMDKPRLVVTPTFLFKCDPDGKLSVDVSQPILDKKKDATVTIYLLNNPQCLLLPVSVEIQKDARNRGIDAISSEERAFLTISPNDLVTAPPADIHLVCRNSEKAFSPPDRTRTMFQAEIPLTINLPVDQANQMRDQLRADGAHLVFDVHATLSARKWVSSGTGRAEYFQLKESEAFKQMTGPGGPFNVKVGDQGLRINSAAVRRDIKERLFGQIHDELKIRIQRTGGSEQLVEQFQNQFQKVVDAATASFAQPIEDERKFATDFAEFLRIKMDEKDITSDDVSGFVANVRDFLKTDSTEKRHFHAGIKMSGFFGLTSGEANATTTNEDLRKQLKDRGFEVALGKAGKFVPKSIDVTMISLKRLLAHRGFELTMTEGIYTALEASQIVTTLDRIDPTKTGTSDEVQFERARAADKQAREAVAELQENLEGAKKILDQATMKLAAAKARIDNALLHRDTAAKQVDETRNRVIQAQRAHLRNTWEPVAKLIGKKVEDIMWSNPNEVSGVWTNISINLGLPAMEGDLKSSERDVVDAKSAVVEPQKAFDHAQSERAKIARALRDAVDDAKIAAENLSRIRR